MFEIVSLKHTNIVGDYYKEFEALLNLFQLCDDYASSIFTSNLRLQRQPMNAPEELN